MDSLLDEFDEWELQEQEVTMRSRKPPELFVQLRLLTPRLIRF